MSNCLNLIPVLSRPEYRIRWTNVAAINLTFDPVTKKYLLGQSETLNVLGDLVVEERYKVTRFVIGGPAVGSWTPWARTTRLPIAGAVLKFYIRTSGKNWIEIGSNGINVNQTYLNTLSGANQLQASAVMSVPSGVFKCSSEVTTSTSRAININKGVATTVTWGSTFISPSTAFKGSNVMLTGSSAGVVTAFTPQGSTSTSPRPNLTGQVTYVRPSTGQVTTINTALKITSNLHPGQTFDASANFNLDVLKVGNHTLTLNYVNPIDGTLASSSAAKISINIVDPNITYNLSSCNLPAGRKPQEFSLPRFGSNTNWKFKLTGELNPTWNYVSYKTMQEISGDSRHYIGLNHSLVLSPQTNSSSNPVAALLWFGDSTPYSRAKASIVVVTDCPATINILGSYTIYLTLGNLAIPFKFTFKR
jgi:hypothetical protein